MTLLAIGSLVRVARADDYAMPVVPPMPLDAAPPDCATATTIGGIVRDQKTNEVLAGATIVLSGPLATSEAQTAITDETGTFSFGPVTPGAYTVTVYYAEATWEQHVDALRGHQVSIQARIDTTDHGIIGCYFGPPPITYAAMPHYGLDVERAWQPVARDRTSRAWIAPVAGADPSRAVTAIGGGHRFTTALGVPLAFVDSVQTHTLRTPIDAASGAGGASAVALVSGSNEAHAEARAIAGTDGGRGEALVSAPIVEDHAWFAAGLVANDRRDLDGLLRFDAMPTVDQTITVAGIGQTHAGGARDDWADAAWTGKFDDYKLQLHAGVTAEHLALPGADAAIARASDPVAAPAATTTNRVGGRAEVIDRVKLAGYHRLYLGFEGGGGGVDRVRHGDASLYAGDEWDFEPNLRVEAGLRFEQRVFAEARTQVMAPRLALDWDWTKEGRSSAFVAYQRVPHLDDGAIGAWVTADKAALATDEVAAGIEYELEHVDWIAAGVASRTRWEPDGVKSGVEGWVRVRHARVDIHAGATSLDGGAATLMARATFDKYEDKLDLIASARIAGQAAATPAIGQERRQGGLGVAWRHRGAKHTDYTTTLEGFVGDLGPALRLVLAAHF